MKKAAVSAMLGIAKAVGKPLYFWDLQTISRQSLRQAQNFINAAPVSGNVATTVLPWLRVMQAREVAQAIFVAAFSGY